MSFLSSVASPLTSLFGGSSSQSSVQSAVSSQDAFGPYRSGLASLVNNLISDPSSIQSFPGYQFGMSQGTQAIQGNAASAGMLNSGNTLSSLNTFGQNYGQQNWLQDISEIANVAQGNPAYAGLSAEGNLANTAGQTSALSGGLGMLGSLFGSSGSGSSGLSGIGSWFGSLFGSSGSSGAASGGLDLMDSI